MTLPITEREKLWDAFLARWPLESLATMSLEDYTRADSKDSFTYWVEFGTQELGSIRGGGAFKFGIYRRKGTIKEKREHFAHDDVYSWYAKYAKHNKTHEEAFENVRSLVASCASAARHGNLLAIDAIDLGDVYKWKLAFLYQNRDIPTVLPIYKADHLRAAIGGAAAGLKHPLLYERLLADRQNAPLFEYADKVWARATAALAASLSPEQALAYFHAHPNKFSPIKEPTQYIAGFRNQSGLPIALVRGNKETTLFLSPGPWFEGVRGDLGNIQEYSPDKSRNSNLGANAPELGVGWPALSVRVPSQASLIAVCDAYDDFEPLELKTMTAAADEQLQSVPLNQIFFGPPGTGKTYASVDASLEILDPAFLIEHKDDRPALKARFDALTAAGHIRFVTFHQSYSYEDFVEGLKAESDEDGRIRYEVAPGVFKSLCDAAAARVTKQADAPLDLSGRHIWKMSLGNTLGADASIYQECISQGYALLGWGGTIDFSGVHNREDVYQRFVGAGDTVTKDSYAVTAVTTFVLKVKQGDLIVVTEGNSKFRAIGEVTGDYKCINRDEQGEDYGQCRTVKWLRVYSPSLPHDQLMNNQFSQMTLYELKPGVVDMNKLAGLLSVAARDGAEDDGELVFRTGDRFGGYVVHKVSNDILELEKPNGNYLPIGMSLLRALAGYVQRGMLTIADIREKRVFAKVSESKLEPFLVNGYNNLLPLLVEKLGNAAATERTAGAVDARQVTAKVLIIDEINRGNVSRVFGELITLLEPSKRQNALEALEVVLPYSKERFSIPDNVYLIGTMNTADRSLAGLDIALRRRFTFKEMPPRPQELDSVQIQGVNIGPMLRVINQRIEVLLDRDHCLGHAYFLALRTEPTLGRLASIFRLQILPLLQEYFFEDWERIRWVLNDHRKRPDYQFIVQGAASLAELFGNDIAELSNAKAQWQLNASAFNELGSYAGIVAGEF